MLSTVLGLFTGKQKWLYIALVVCAVGFVGASALSISLFADKTALHVSLSSKEGEIKTLKEEHQEAIEAIEKKLTGLQKEKDEVESKLAQRNADIQTQNALIEQNRVDLIAKEKSLKEAMAKKPKIVTDIKYVPTGGDECNDLKAIIDEYILTGGTQQ